MPGENSMTNVPFAPELSPVRTRVGSLKSSPPLKAAQLPGERSLACHCRSKQDLRLARLDWLRILNSTTNESRPGDFAAFCSISLSSGIRATASLEIQEFALHKRKFNLLLRSLPRTAPDVSITRWLLPEQMAPREKKGQLKRGRVCYRS